MARRRHNKCKEERTKESLAMSQGFPDTSTKKRKSNKEMTQKRYPRS